jgi:1-aminocyclopropane-1-carboxylate deaminase
MLNYSIVETLQHPLFDKHNIVVKIKRDDLIHPIISGNKWRKLLGNVTFAKTKKYRGILSFGGAYSNHIHALAYTCQQHQLPAVGVIRGEPAYRNNFTLSWAEHWGMQLRFVDRKTYRRRTEKQYLQVLQQQYPNYFIIPEGGSNQLALSGVAQLVSELKQQSHYDTLLLPVASGGTLAGIISADTQHQLIGIAVLKGGEFLEKTINDLLINHKLEHNNWRILNEFHRGGYAKFSAEDSERLRVFSQQVGVPFEPIYSGKMVLALLDLIAANYFPKNHTVMLIHTGGLQSLAGLAEQQKINGQQWPIPNSAP